MWIWASQYMVKNTTSNWPTSSTLTKGLTIGKLTIVSPREA
jgi:hypothetical protein